MKRRRFLQSTVGGLGTLAVFPGMPADEKPKKNVALTDVPADFPKDPYQMPEWLRYAQPIYFDGYSPPIYPNLKEFGAKRLLDVVEELGGNAVRFQPIGYWAYYPSKAFRVHPDLAGRDTIQEVTEECRKRGVHCYCYTGYGHPHMEVGWVDKHPEFADWVMRDPDGKPYGTFWHIGWALRQRPCNKSDAYRAGIRQVVRELCQHDIEGVYFDAPSAFGYSGICFCHSCRHNFEKFSGIKMDRLNGLAKMQELPYDWGEIPADVDMDALTAWYAWSHQLTREDLLDFRKIIHGSGKFMLCHNGQSWYGTSLPLQYRIPEGFMVEASRDVLERLMTGLKGASMARPQRKVAQMYLGGYGVNWFGEPPHEQPWMVHNANLEDGDEIRMEGFTNLACGNTPLYATANRLCYKVGSGSDQPAREVYELMRRVESFHKDSAPVPYVSIVPTWESQQLWRTRRKSANWPSISSGMGLAMLDSRISMDVYVSTEINDAWLAGQRVIALCGASGISNELAGKLSKWVEQGGGLLATYDSGLFDERGEMRNDGGALMRLLCVRMKGAPLHGEPECYFKVKESHPSLGDYAAGAILQGDGKLVPVEPIGDAKVLADCWNLGTNQVRGPAVVVNSHGKGRTIYVSGSLEANYLYDRVKSNQQLLASMVHYLGGDAPQPFLLKAPKGVYGILRRAPSGDLTLWVLANVGFKDAVFGRMRQEYVALQNVEVGIQIPPGRRAKSLQLVRAGKSVPIREENGYAMVTVPNLHIAEIVHLELG